MPFLRHFTMNIIITPAQAKHCVILLWGGATSSHLNSLGSIQATRLPLGMVNLFGMHIIPPLTITARYQFYTLVRWGTYGVHIFPRMLHGQLTGSTVIQTHNLWIQSPMRYSFGHHVYTHSHPFMQTFEKCWDRITTGMCYENQL